MRKIRKHLPVTMKKSEYSKYERWEISKNMENDYQIVSPCHKNGVVAFLTGLNYRDARYILKKLNHKCKGAK